MSLPVIVHESERDWEGWPGEEVAERGEVQWRTLFSEGLTPTDALTTGIAVVPPGGRLASHHHAQSEIYLILEGDGVLEIDGASRTVRPGTAVFIPGGARHGIACRSDSELRFAYVLAADSFGEVTYVF